MDLTKQRSYGLDLLRILSMFLVVILHLMGAGGVLVTLTPGGVRYVSAWGLEIVASCAVNCYGLLSGYVGYGHSHTRKKLFSLWLQVLFFSVLLSWGVGLYFQGALSFKDILYPCLPVLTVQYWYFTAYFALALLMPYLDRMLAGLDKRQSVELMAVLVLLFSVLPLFSTEDLFATSGGYTFLWLMVLYLLGACVKKCEPFFERPIWHYGLGFVGCIVLGLVGKLAGDVVSAQYFSSIAIGARLSSYTSPLLLAAALFLLLFFRSWKVKNRAACKLIAFFAPISFGVYIIHTNGKVWTYLLADSLVWVAQLPAPLLVLTILGIAAAVFVGCSLLDFLRLKLFRLFGKLRPKKEEKEPVGHV